MKKNELKALPADAVLDAELAQMAEEVPPMPADFHARWVNAVRAEAAKAVPETEEKTQKNPVSIVRWTRILSVAAVFMFLIGGTILYRNAGKTLTSPIVAQEKKAAEQDAGAVAAEEPEVLYMNAEEPAAVGAAGAAEETEDAAVPEMHILMAEAYEEAPQADAEAPMMDAEAMVTDAAEEDASAEAAYENYGEARTNKAAEGGALMMNAAEKASGAAASATAAPTEPAPEPEEESEPEREAETPAEENGFLQSAGAFFTDMGDFLLAALPYLAVLAVPAVIALVIRQLKKRG